MQLQYAQRAPTQTISTRHNGPRPKTRPTGPRPRHIAPRPRRNPRRIGPRPRWDQDVEDFVQDETKTRRQYVSRPSQDRDVSTETTSLQITDLLQHHSWEPAFCNDAHHYPLLPKLEVQPLDLHHSQNLHTPCCRCLCLDPSAIQSVIVIQVSFISYSDTRNLGQSPTWVRPAP